MDYQIGWLAEQVDGTFKGTIRTLTIQEQITIRPVTGSPRGNASQYDVLIGSGARMGFARRDEGGIAVTLRSPELVASITARLAAADRGEWLLVWSCTDD